MEKTNCVLEVQKLSKSFSGKRVLDNLSFSVHRGECAAIVGENGAGKSTLFRILFSLLRPGCGDILIDGVSAKTGTKRSAQIGLFMGGDAALYGRLTARENITFFARLNGVSAEDTRRRIDEYAALFDMRSYLDRPCARFSHGMRQKSALVRAIIHDPSVIILDEPMTGLDISTIRAVKEFIACELDKKKTILYATHSMQEVISVCSRMLLLHRGRLLGDFPVEGIVSTEALEETIADLICASPSEME